MSALEQEVAKLLAPLRHLHETAVTDERLAQAKLDQARAQRREIERMLRAVDPDFYEKNGKGKPGRKPATNGAVPAPPNFSDERLRPLVDWLQANAERLNEMNGGDGFVASQVAKNEEVPAISSSQSTFSKMLLVLHERGIVRLNKIGGGVRGGQAKLYKVVV
jgi:hypothetical protein